MHRGKITPTLVNGSREAEVTGQSVYDDRSAEADLDGVKRLIPPVKSRGAQTQRDIHAVKAAAAKPGTHEVRVHASRTSGRHRLDASRVFWSGRLQDLVE